MLSVLEEDYETTASGIVRASAGGAIILLALAVTVYMMMNTEMGEDNGEGTHAGIAGYYVGLLCIILINSVFRFPPLLLLGFAPFIASGPTDLPV